MPWIISLQGLSWLMIGPASGYCVGSNHLEVSMYICNLLVSWMGVSSSEDTVSS